MILQPPQQAVIDYFLIYWIQCSILTKLGQLAFPSHQTPTFVSFEPG